MVEQAELAVGGVLLRSCHSPITQFRHTTFPGDIGGVQQADAAKLSVKAAALSAGEHVPACHSSTVHSGRVTARQPPPPVVPGPAATPRRLPTAAVTARLPHTPQPAMSFTTAMSAPPATRQLATAFHRYERDRCAFVSSIAEAARIEGHAGPLNQLGAPALLLPLLDDPCPAVAHVAAAALGRLAGHSRVVASRLAGAGVVAATVQRLKERASAAADAADPADAATDLVASKRGAVGLLAALARHSVELAGSAAAQGGLALAVECVSDADAEVREGAGACSWVGGVVSLKVLCDLKGGGPECRHCVREGRSRTAILRWQA